MTETPDQPSTGYGPDQPIPEHVYNPDGVDPAIDDDPEDPDAEGLIGDEVPDDDPDPDDPADDPDADDDDGGGV